MKRNLDQLSTAAAGLLVDEFGFSRNKLRFIREDSLARSAWFVPGKHASKATYNFELILDLGLPGLSAITSAAQPWVVRASAEKVYRKRTPAPRVKFAFRDGIYGNEIESVVLEMLRVVADEFFLKLRSPDDLYEFIRSNSLDFLREGMAAENEFKKLDLMPWNVLPRMQLAAVYAAYLGRSDDALELEQELAEYAAKNRLEYLMAGVRESIANVSRRPS
jgi:hypothetical protein